MEAADADVASLKEQMLCADMEKADQERNVLEVGEISKKLMVFPEAALVAMDRAEKLTRPLVVENGNSVDTVALQLRHNVVNSLPPGLEAEYYK